MRFRVLTAQRGHARLILGLGALAYGSEAHKHGNAAGHVNDAAGYCKFFNPRARRNSWKKINKQSSKSRFAVSALHHTAQTSALLSCLERGAAPPSPHLVSTGSWEEGVGCWEPSFGVSRRRWYWFVVLLVVLCSLVANGTCGSFLVGAAPRIAPRWGRRREPTEGEKLRENRGKSREVSI